MNSFDLIGALIYSYFFHFELFSGFSLHEKLCWNEFGKFNNSIFENSHSTLLGFFPMKYLLVFTKTWIFSYFKVFLNQNNQFGSLSNPCQKFVTDEVIL